MIDPENVTNYHLSRAGREENMLFWLLVAGKTADVVAAALDRILREARAATGSRARSPFAVLRAYRAAGKRLRPLLKRHGIGCHGLKARGIVALLDGDPDLATCTPDELCEVPGVGPKTARCFILHTREGADVAGLDTHMLRYLGAMREAGKGTLLNVGSWPKVPTTTPSSPKVYAYWEGVVRQLARERNLTMAQFDLGVFNASHRRVGRTGGRPAATIPAACAATPAAAIAA